MLRKQWFCLKTMVLGFQRRFLSFIRRFTKEQALYKDVDFVEMDEVDFLMKKNSRSSKINARGETCV